MRESLPNGGFIRVETRHEPGGAWIDEIEIFIVHEQRMASGWAGESNTVERWTTHHQCHSRHCDGATYLSVTVTTAHTVEVECGSVMYRHTLHLGVEKREIVDHGVGRRLLLEDRCHWN